MSIEPLIETAASMKAAVERMLAAYVKLPPCIEREHAAIRATNFAAMQLACDEKEQLGAEIEGAFTDLSRLCDELGRKTGEKRPASLKEAVAALQQVVAGLSADDLASQVLAFQVAELAKVAATLDDTHKRTKPLIDANKYLVTGMLHNIQESYLFWQQVAEQVQSSYNQQGVQKTQGRAHGFTAKA